MVTFMRTRRLTELISVLTREVETAYNQFNLSVPDWMYKINANASVISLQHHIKRELDVDAVITELDGKPIDFLIEVTGFVDESQLRVLIDNFKLSGKSYIFKLGSVVYSCKFTNHVCELEQADNKLTIHYSGGNVYVSSQHPVTTNLELTLYYFYQDSGLQKMANVHISKNASVSETISFIIGVQGAIPVFSIINPMADLNYIYKP